MKTRNGHGITRNLVCGLVPIIVFACSSSGQVDTGTNTGSSSAGPSTTTGASSSGNGVSSNGGGASSTGASTSTASGASGGAASTSSSANTTTGGASDTSASGATGASSGTTGPGTTGASSGTTGGGTATGSTGTTGATAGTVGGSTSGGTSSAMDGGSAASPSAGCGTATSLQSGRASIDVSGTSREYVLQLPSQYDPSHPYRLIFAWHWRGGTANDVVSGTIIGGPYYGLQSRSAGSAILVAPEGIDMGWANTNGRDIAFLKAMLAQFESSLCIDQSRIFSTGFSYGGMMSDEIGTEMGDVFRAIAAMSGACYSGGCRQTTMHPIAAWMSHGNNDTTVPIADGQSARDKFLAVNQCGTQTVATTPSPCVEYQGCASGYPVVWCEFSGGHMPVSFGPDAIWNFFNRF